MKKILLVLCILPIGAMAQIWAGFSGGASFTTVNPQENFGYEQGSRVNSAYGFDAGLTFSADFTDKIKLMGRLTYNQTQALVYHRYIEVQGLENHIMGKLESDYLGLYLAPMWHKGQGLQFVYGLGFYTGFKMSGTITGDYWTEENGKESERYELTNARADTYRDLATGLFTTLGFNFNVTPKIQLNLNADVVLFLNAKNIIFQDTGSVNEINLRFGVSYLFEKREE
ncbi:MAG: outer membrane beta-barrel protein [Bacteroidia bacterium]